MTVAARVLFYAGLTAGLGCVVGFSIAGGSPNAPGIALLVACVGGVIGALAGTAGEIVAALNQRPAA